MKKFFVLAVIVAIGIPVGSALIRGGSPRQKAARRQSANQQTKEHVLTGAERNAVVAERSRRFLLGLPDLFPPKFPLPPNSSNCLPLSLNGGTGGPYVDGDGVTEGVEYNFNWDCSSGYTNGCHICIAICVYKDGNEWPAGDGGNVFCQSIDSDCNRFNINTYGNFTLGQGGNPLPSGTYSVLFYIFSGTCQSYNPASSPIYQFSTGFIVD